MSAALVKDVAHQLIDSLPENATWNDLIHEIYIRETIEKGLSESNDDDVLSVAEVRAKYGLK